MLRWRRGNPYRNHIEPCTISGYCYALPCGSTGLHREELGAGPLATGPALFYRIRRYPRECEPELCSQTMNGSALIAERQISSKNLPSVRAIFLLGDVPPVGQLTTCRLGEDRPILMIRREEKINRPINRNRINFQTDPLPPCPST